MYTEREAQNMHTHISPLIFWETTCGGWFTRTHGGTNLCYHLTSLAYTPTRSTKRSLSLLLSLFLSLSFCVLLSLSLSVFLCLSLTPSLCLDLSPLLLLSLLSKENKCMRVETWKQMKNTGSNPGPGSCQGCSALYLTHRSVDIPW